MTNIPLLNFALVLGSGALVAMATVAAMRKFTHAPSRRELWEDGVVLAENGIDFLGFLWIRRHLTYGTIESVKVIPFFKALLPIYGINVIWVWTSIRSQVLVVKVKQPNFVKGLVISRYLLFTPRDAPVLAEQLRERIRSHEKRAA